MSKTVLVIGASGIIGSAHARRLAANGTNKVLALSRSTVNINGVKHVPLDLINDDLQGRTELNQVTHAVYTGFIDAPGWQAQKQPNIKLFQASLDLVKANCPDLEHFTLVQGMKAYGTHLGPHKTPSRESDPRIPQGHFYFDQQDLLAESGQKWTAIRPHVVLGSANRSPQNLIAVLAVYASLCKAEGRPLTFPGDENTFQRVCQATDADLLSKALEWAGGVAGVFNITNGDFYRWSSLWPKIADLFDMAWDGPNKESLQEKMPDKEVLWQKLVEEHSLHPIDLGSFVSWAFADYIFGIGWDIMAHTGKSREAGFLEFVDTEQSILQHLEAMRRQSLIP